MRSVLLGLRQWDHVLLVLCGQSRLDVMALQL